MKIDIYKFKVIEEYEKFYLAINEKGFRECFLKKEYTPENGVITKRREYNYHGGTALPKEKVNKIFNPGKKFLW
jgi:hypothetical protein